MIRLLLSVYPAAWRAEYGEELAALLRSRPLSLSIVANVLANAFCEQLRQNDPANFFQLLSSCIFIIGAILFYLLQGSGTPLLFWLSPLALLFILASTVTAWSMHRGKTFRRSCWITLRAGLTLAIVSTQAFFSDASRFFCGTNGIPGCGITTLFFRGSLHPPLHLQIFVAITTLASVYATGILFGLAIGHSRKQWNG